MFSINIDRIMDRVGAYAVSSVGQKTMSHYIKNIVASGKSTNTSGSKILTNSEMLDVAAKLIEMIKNTANSCHLPSSVMEHVNGLERSNVLHRSDGSSVIHINFGGDKHRDSLAIELYPEGVDNIVALFNNGYQTSNSVYGWWRGHSVTGDAIYDYRNIHGLGDTIYIKSKISRDGAQFVNSALKDFNNSYSSLYGVIAIASSDYEKT